MRYPLALGLLVAPTLAVAEDDGTTSQPVPTSETAKAVIGGSAAPPGKWPDAVAVMWSGDQGCTGTLVAPTVVLTAGHCIYDPNDLPNQVLVGASALSKVSEGQMISIQKSIEYPNSWNTVDAGILILSQPATVAPRPIASGWAKFDIKNGASVQLVGFGTTDRNGSRPTDALMEATTTITDHDCSMSPDCNTGARPDGELIAGGMGIDTCPGDSGGPVYLDTPYGAFVTGITSRGFETSRYACSDGGVYGRADKIVDWIEQQSGVKVARGPAPSAEPITVVRGDGETQIVHNDPKQGAEHAYEITTPPAHVKAAVRSDGRVRVCGVAGMTGGDEFIVTVTDTTTTDAARSLPTKITVLLEDGSGDDDCNPMAFSDDGGCCDTRRSASGSIPLAFAVLLVLRRRRK
jgi:secreted trypsin-like serine protease